MSVIEKPGGECLHFRDPSWYVIFYRDGRQKLLSLRTADLAEAEARRDAFFLEHGAKPRVRSRAAGRVPYVYRRTEWYVKHPAGLRGDFETEEAAVAAIREFEKTLKPAP